MFQWRKAGRVYSAYSYGLRFIHPGYCSLFIMDPPPIIMRWFTDVNNAFVELVKAEQRMMLLAEVEGTLCLTNDTIPMDPSDKLPLEANQIGTNYVPVCELTMFSEYDRELSTITYRKTLEQLIILDIRMQNVVNALRCYTAYANAALKEINKYG